MIKKSVLLLLLMLLLFSLTGCERPSTIAPVAMAPTNAPSVKVVTPTLMIKTPVKVATQPSGFQEILSATQTAVATLRSGTLTATAEATLLTGTPGTGTPDAMNGAGIGTLGANITPMALGTIYPETETPTPLPGVTGTPGTSGTPTMLNGTLTIPTATKIVPSFYIPGVPTFGIESVVGDGTVTIMTSEFPANSKYTVYMGPNGSRGYGGTLVGTFDTNEGGIMTLVFNIPATLRGYSPIDIRIEFPDGRYAFNFFYNITAS